MPESTEKPSKKVSSVIGVLKVLIRPWTNNFLRKDDLKEFMTEGNCTRIHSMTEAALDRLTGTIMDVAKETRETLRLFDLKSVENDRRLQDQIIEILKQRGAGR